MALFGSKKPTPKTFVVLDIETGSVGGVLMHRTPGEAPRLFGETRVDLAIGTTRDAHTLRERAAHALESVAQSLSHVAARVRGNEATAHMGSASHAVAFLAAPWGTPNLESGAPQFSADMVGSVQSALASTFAVPLSVHARASATLHGARLLFPYEENYIIGMPHGEVSEVLEIVGGNARSHGTLPVGRNTMVRTFMSHGGLHEDEGRSALKALSLGHVPAHLSEPVRHTYEHVATHFNDLATSHGWHEHGRVYSFAHDGDWFARALAHSSAARKFPDGAVVTAIRAKHFSPYLAGHAQVPDLGLMLGGLFVDSHYR